MISISSLNMNVFAQYPVSEDAIIVPMMVGTRTIDELKAMLKETYQIEIEEAEYNGKKGYKDQNGRFFLHRVVNSPIDLGEFMDEVGFSEEQAEAMLRKLH